MKTEILKRGIALCLLAISSCMPAFARSADEVRGQVEALEEAGEYAQAADLLETEFELLQAAADERLLFMQLAGMLNESDQAVARIAELTVRTDTEPEDRYALYLLGALYLTREEFALSASVLQGLIQLEPENARAAGLFLMSCLGAGNDCPPLWPVKRRDRSEISCKEAIELSALTNPGTLEVVENGLSIHDLIQDPDKSWVTASAAYSAATIVQTEASEETLTAVSQAIILYDTIMGCFPDSEGTRYYREYTRSQSVQELNGEEVFFQDLYFHENLRQNRLDLAWELKGYNPEFTPSPGQE